MSDKKRLYFIPIIDRALSSDQPAEALKKAFEEIRELGKEPKYKEGFRQFQDFIEMAVKLPGKEPDTKRQHIRNAIYQLISDLVTDTFEGSPDKKESLIREITKNPEWRVEYERIKEEMKPLLFSQPLLQIEVLKDGELIASFPISGSADQADEHRSGAIYHKAIHREGPLGRSTAEEASHMAGRIWR